jgi:predicted  nucleic acid-binding Zn-ribbon protein
MQNCDSCYMRMMEYNHVNNMKQQLEGTLKEELTKKKKATKRLAQFQSTTTMTQEIEDLQKQVNDLTKQCNELEEENAKLSE